jgi:hypothetical protein
MVDCIGENSANDDWLKQSQRCRGEPIKTLTLHRATCLSPGHPNTTAAAASHMAKFRVTETESDFRVAETDSDFRVARTESFCRVAGAEFDFRVAGSESAMPL